MASEAVGGLYVAVGIDADPAIAKATRLQDKMVGISDSINRLNKNTNLDQLIKKMERLAAASEKIQVGAVKAAPAAPSRQASVGAANSRNQAQIDAEVLASRLRLNQDFVNRIIQLEMNKNLNIEQQTRLAVARESALRLRQALDEQRLDEATYNKKMSLLNKEVAEVQRATQQQIRAQQQAAEAAQRRGSLGSVLGSGTTDLLTGLGAARSGNYFYGLAALSRYFKNVTSELGKFKQVAGEVSGGMDDIGAASGRAGKGTGGAAQAFATLQVAAIAAAAAVPLVGIALTAVGVKIAQVGLEQATNLEMLKIQYEGLLGSAKKANAEVSRVLELGTRSIVPTEQLLDANRLLLAFGVTAEGTRSQLLEFISAFSSVTGASLTQVQNLSYALGQINAAGKANAIDLRQLANAGLSSQQIFKEIAKQQGISVAEAKKLSDEGKLYANVIIPAILAQTKNLSAAQDKARNSVYGIIVNLKDIANIKVGAAFEGLLQKLKPILKWVESFIKAFDFRIIAEAFDNVVGYFREEFAGLGADARDTSRSISQTIAKAVNLVGYVSVQVAKFVVAVFNTAMVGINFLWAGTQELISGTLYAISKVMEAAARIPGPWQESAREIADTTWALAEESAAGAKIATDGWINGAYAVKDTWISLLTDIPTWKGIDTRDFNTLGAEGPKGQRPVPTLQFDDPINDIKAGGSKAKDAANAFIDLMKELIAKAAAAAKDLAENLTLPFAAAIKAGGAKIKTAAEEAFTSGDIETIVSKFSDLRDQIIDLYGPMENARLAGSKKLAQTAKAQRKALITELRGQTFELVRLASDTKRLAQELDDAEKELEKVQKALEKRTEEITSQYNAQQKKIARQFDDYYVATSATEGRFVKGAITLAQEALDAAAEKYEKAKEKLDELRQAREAFLSSLADTVRGYVNSLSGVAKEVEKYTRLNDLGSFMMSKSSQVDLESFKKSLNDRLEVLRNWRVQVANLMSRGLDSDFLQSIVSQGPEASKDIVSALAGASDAELADLNNIQKQLSTEILALQESSSQQWFDAGIAAQEAFTAPLKAAYDAAQKQVTDLQTQKDLALGVLEAWYAEQNELIAAEEKAAQDRFNATKADLEAKMTANQTKASEIANAINGLWNKLPPKSYMTGVAIIDKLLEGLKSKEGELIKEANRIADRITSTIAKALKVNSPSKVMIEIGESVGEGLAAGMRNAAPEVDSAALELSNFSRAFSTLPSLPENQEPAAPPVVKVFIGDKELTDIVDVRIEDASRADRDLVIAGRRY